MATNQQEHRIECIGWNTFTKRVLEEVEKTLRTFNGTKNGSIAKVKITMLAGVDGPFVIEIDASRIEPSNRAKEFLIG